MMLLKKPSHSWWFDSHNSPRRSTWLQSTLSELDQKTETMLKLIEEDADSFAQRAEMYYKKRPELISMVEDFYRAHRSLAERFDLLKSDNGNRLLGSPLHRLQRSTSPLEKYYDSYSQTCESDESGDSEVDDPEEPEKEEEVVTEEDNDSEVMKVLPMETEEDNGSEVMKVKLMEGEIERLKEENRIQKAQLIEKDEAKREVIRQLSLAMEILKEENVNLKKHLAKDERSRKNGVSFHLDKLKEAFTGKLFNGFSPVL